MKIQCRTIFDCQATGVTGHFRPSQLPFQDRAGQDIRNQTEWNRSRNQQRNWETLLQIISLRTQPTVLATPVFRDQVWQFEFETATDGVYSATGQINDLGLLYQDCGNVPMIGDVGNAAHLTPVLLTQGADQNIWFEPVNT